MNKAEKIFHQIVNETPDAMEGKLFGAFCIKTKHGKAIAIFWKENMLFKLDEKVKQEALKLDGSKIASHLYAPEKLMKEWVSIPFKHADKWAFFTNKAIISAKAMKKALDESSAAQD